jgi:hypothetical protein
MAELSIGDAVGAGFQLIRRRPVPVMIWGLAGLVTAVAAFGIFGSFYTGLISGIVRSGGTFNPMVSPDVVGQARRIQGSGLLLNLFSLFVNCVVYCAVFRSIIHPEQSRFAYLRIGVAELFALVLLIAGYVAFLVSLLVPALIVGVVVTLLVAAHAGGIAVIVGVLGLIAVMICLIYVAVRLSLVVPMMVSDNRFHLADAWALAKNHVGAMLVIWIALIAILLVAEIVFGLVLLALGLGYLSSAAGGLSHLQDFFRRDPAEILASATPVLLVLGVLSVPLTGCTFAVMGAPWARAFRDLSGPDLAATFS